MLFVRKLGWRRLLGVGVILLGLLSTLLVASVASAQATPKPRTWHALIGAQSKDFMTQGMVFLPGQLWINVGDTVVWSIESGDIHTVTFLPPGQKPPPFNPADPTQALPQGGSVYDGVSYFNSGLMLDFPGIQGPGGLTYSLTFAVAGDFTYYCLVHPGMIAKIHVRPAGTPYPFSQGDYSEQINRATQDILRDGQRLADQARDKSNNLHVTVGIGDGLTTQMRFYPGRITVHVGDTVTFTNRDVMEPHTVSFGTFPTNFNDFLPAGNPKAFDGSTLLNSGFIGASPAWFGTTFQVTFVKAGTYAFRCDLHDFMGMLITITVT